MDGAKAKVKWAEKRIKELDSAIDSFLNPVGRLKPYSIGIKRDSQTGEIIYHLASREIVPNDIVLLAGDVLQNLRSALDYAVCSLTVANGKSVSSQTGFPIFDHAPASPDDQSLLTRKIGGAGKEAIDYILQTKPYEGGNQALWRLHALNIRDKHRLLLTAGVALGDFNVGQHLRATRLARGFVSDYWITVGQPWILRNVGETFLIDTSHVKENDNVQFKFDVAFDELGVAEGEPIKIELGKALNWVTGIVLDLGNFLP